jgi:hypothetical protein
MKFFTALPVLVLALVGSVLAEPRVRGTETLAHDESFENGVRRYRGTKVRQDLFYSVASLIGPELFFQRRISFLSFLGL